MGAELDIKLLDATERDELSHVESLLKAGANPNAQDIICLQSPLQVSACKDNLEMVKLLVRYGAKINAVAGDAPSTALECAAIAGRKSVVEWLLENNAQIQVDASIDDLIDEVIKFGDHDIAALLRKAFKCQR